ncbi:hypothetical protein C2I36_10200 [Rhodobacteraceae bacterium WD3A24]|nr:hypothetical protein C2I36_10200 [Rhodobacteraceae bacterium WD3A24]
MLGIALLSGIAAQAQTDGASQAVLDGLMQVDPPEGWRIVIDREERLNMRTSGYEAVLDIYTGAAGREAAAVDAVFEAAPQESDGSFLGQPARVYRGAAAFTAVMEGTRQVRGQDTVYVLDDCLPGPSPIVAHFSAAPGWLEENGLDAVLAGMDLALPETAVPCPEPIRAGAQWELGGMAAFTVPEGMEITRSRSSATLRPDGGGRPSLTISSDPAAFETAFRPLDRFGNGFDGVPELRETATLGHDALLFAGRGGYEDTRWTRHVAVLDRCLEDAQPVMVDMRADDDWIATRGGFDALLDNVWLYLPDDAAPCPPETHAGLSAAVGAEPADGAPEAEPADDAPAAEPADDAPAAKPADDAPATEPAAPNPPAPEAAAPDAAPSDPATPAPDAPGTRPDVPATPPAPRAPEADAAKPPAAAQPGPDSQDADLQRSYWEAIRSSNDPSDYAAYLSRWPNGLYADLARNNLQRLGAAAPPAAPGALDPHGPDGRAIIARARETVARVIGQPVEFDIEVLRAGGGWAYLQATPRQPDGHAIEWMNTPFAQDWQADMMSDVVMVLLREAGDVWQVQDYVIGPTDVYWFGWMERHALPQTLFMAP